MPFLRLLLVLSILLELWPLCPVRASPHWRYKRALVSQAERRRSGPGEERCWMAERGGRSRRKRRWQQEQELVVAGDGQRAAPWNPSPPWAMEHGQLRGGYGAGDTGSTPGGCRRPARGSGAAACEPQAGTVLYLSGGKERLKPRRELKMPRGPFTADMWLKPEGGQNNPAVVA
eukprot:g24702.t1